MIVDKPEYRERLNLDTKPTADDAAKTYTNMLKVFEPQLYPWVEAQGRLTTTEGRRATLAISITLHGRSFEYLLPVDLVIDAERLLVQGTATIRHSDFGVEPFAAAGGLLRVADEMEVEFKMAGQRMKSH